VAKNARLKKNVIKAVYELSLSTNKGIPELAFFVVL
jgi:hypothetical protein